LESLPTLRTPPGDRFCSLFSSAESAQLVARRAENAGLCLIRDTAGHTSTSSGFFNFALVRYNGNGSLDTAFGNQGIVLTNFGQFDDARALALQGDGKLVAAGVTNNGTSTLLALARYNNDGSLDTSFGTNGQVTTNLGRLNQAIQSLALSPDGKLVVAGSYAPPGPSQFFLARYNTNGSLDTTFGNAGTVLTAIDPEDDNGAAGIGFLPDGTLVAAGTAGSDFAVARYWGDQGPPEYARGSADAPGLLWEFSRWFLTGNREQAGDAPGLSWGVVTLVSTWPDPAKNREAPGDKPLASAEGYLVTGCGCMGNAGGGAVCCGEPLSSGAGGGGGVEAPA
jgi:uncharacterized delta-60 repeat protein